MLRRRGPEEARLEGDGGGGGVDCISNTYMSPTFGVGLLW